MTDAERIKNWRKSPLNFVKDIWKLEPQPLRHGVANDQPAEFYRPHHFEAFVKGKHLTWQQWLIFRAVEWALSGKAANRISVASGHGIGKSATEAIIILWFLACWKNSKIGCTANTSDQLYDILWSEISLWLKRMPEPIQQWYDWKTAYVRMVDSPESWYARARTAKKEAPEALAGLHADNIAIVVDESSGVHDTIFETAQGALTNDNVLVLLISNPTRLSGYFYNTHHKFKKNWQTMQFDSRESPIVSKTFVEQILNDYGEDSPQFAVRVAGKFPNAEEDQLIPYELFDLASARKFSINMDSPRIGATDVARYGGDATIHSERQGNTAKMLQERMGQDTMATCGDIVTHIKQGELEQNPYDYWCIDVIGLGAGVYDRCKELQTEGVIPDTVKLVAVNVSVSPLNDKEYSNRRAELADEVRKWLRTGSVDERFREQTCSIKYKAPDSKGRLVIEKKEEMKERGLSSPDRFDSLCLSFAIGDATRTRMQERKVAQARTRRIVPNKTASNGAWWL